jgi:hypothetical protein
MGAALSFQRSCDSATFALTERVCVIPAGREEGHLGLDVGWGWVGRWVGLGGREWAADLQHGQAEGSEPSEQPEKSGLVGEIAGEDRADGCRHDLDVAEFGSDVLRNRSRDTDLIRGGSHAPPPLHAVVAI